MNKIVYATVLLLGSCSTASAGSQQNFDFAKSACAPKAGSFEKAIAIRVFPHLTDEGGFALRDGKTDWEKPFGLQSPDAVFNYVSRATFDGWAVYQLHSAENPARFTVQYMFGDVNPAPHDCVVVPETPEPVAIDIMPPLALQMYLSRLTGDGSGSPDQMRSRLRQTLGLPDNALATVRQIAPSVAADATPVSAGTTVANACGVPVNSALVEIGSHQPPKIFTPETVNGHWEFNYLSEADEPLTAMCFRTKDESSLFRVPLPTGLSRCQFDTGALSCSAEAKSGTVQGTNLDELSPEQKARLSAAADEMMMNDPYSRSLLEEPKARIEASDYTGERPTLAGLPTVVAEEFIKWDRSCGQDANGNFTEDYLTMTDIDQDGDQDFILNGDGASCVQSGKIVAMGGGNGGTNLIVFTRQAAKFTKTLDVFIQSAEIRSHQGFTTVVTSDGSYKLISGKAIKLAKPLEGGNVAFLFGR
ncbi:hypothetical protein [Ensifer adhaerens]|uniref:hypothetical protein n=1 Tax=Ensifer adhaerens TaxID=106592 RepID=UPI00131A4779|nr:hypothetical protein [Ensifer adhaerens]